MLSCWRKFRKKIPKDSRKQCCGIGSGIRCLFDPWIRDSE